MDEILYKCENYTGKGLLCVVHDDFLIAIVNIQSLDLILPYRQAIGLAISNSGLLKHADGDDLLAFRLYLTSFLSSLSLVLLPSLQAAFHL